MLGALLGSLAKLSPGRSLLCFLLGARSLMCWAVGSGHGDGEQGAAQGSFLPSLLASGGTALSFVGPVPATYPPMYQMQASEQAG